jgi:phospholipase/carboxylesterase
MSGDGRSTEPSLAWSAGIERLVESRFVPRRYEPNYAYPLLVLLHGRGSDEQHLIQALPSMSWRNYVGLGLRGPETIERDGAPAGHGWGPEFIRPRRGAPRDQWLPRTSSSEPVAETFRKALLGESLQASDTIDESVFESIRGIRRSLHVHSERIFLVGVGEGAAVAYRLGLSYPDRFAGVVALNGWLPARAFRAPVNLRACRSLRILAIHGEWNSRVPVAQARRDVSTLRTAGLKVASQSYPCANRLTGPMLADVDTWLMHQCTMEPRGLE